MKKLTIFDVYVKMTSQAQCDRMKQVCVDNGLKIGSHPQDFDYITRTNQINTFRCSELYDFGIRWLDESKTEVTEEQFMELLKEYKKQL